MRPTTVQFFRTNSSVMRRRNGFASAPVSKKKVVSVPEQPSPDVVSSSSDAPVAQNP